MADLSTHYKERTPEQTIQIVQDFFKEKGFRLLESDINQSEAGTWYNHVDIFLDDVLIGGANGKGVTREYARASGHAELYERFCNNMFFLSNPYWNRKMIDTYPQRGYYFYKDEKILTPEEWSHCCTHAERWLSFFSGNNPSLLSTMIKYITNDIYIGAPAKTLDGQIGMYIDPRLLVRITHSVGMSAGNTVNEALVQGLSELVEKEAFNRFLKDMGGTYTALNIDNITDPVLRPIIDRIRSLGYKLYLIDLSYNFNVPTIMSILIDEKYGLMNINLGSFPVFEIAAERVLTELYQGVKSYRNGFPAGKIHKPYKATYPEEAYIAYGNNIDGSIFDYTFFQQLQYKDTYNKDIFIDKTTTNEELVKYYFKLQDKINIKFYYIETSQSSQIKSVYSFVDGPDVFINTEGYNKMADDVSAIHAKRYINELINLHNNVYNKTEVDYASLTNLIFNEFNMSPSALDCVVETTVWNGVHINPIGMHNFDFLRTLSSAIKNEYTMLEIPYVWGTIFLVPYRKYFQLIYYKITQKYTDEELFYIFNEVYKYNITQIDINKCLSFTYILKKCYVEPLSNYINSEDYDKMMKAYTHSSD